jgi:predicted permease
MWARFVTLFSRLGFVCARRRLDEEARAEFDAHLDLLVDRYIRSGMTAAEARAAAQRQFGSVTLIREEVHQMNGVRWIDGWAQDLRYAARSLRRTPAFTAAALVTLALGIGANTAIFSLLDGVMFKPLDVPAAEELLLLQNVGPDGPDPELGIGPTARFSYPAFQRFVRTLPQGTSLAAMSRIALLNVRYGERVQAARVRGQLVSGAYFSTFRATAARGRLIEDADNAHIDAHPVAVISYAFWQQHLGGSPSAVGRQIVVNGASFTIVGVTAQGFAGVWVDGPTEIWIPLTMQHAVGYRQNFRASNGRSNEPWLPQDGISWLTLVARAPAEVQPQLRAAMELEHQRPMLEFAEAQGIPDAKRREFLLANRLMLTSFERGLSGLRPQFASPLYLLTALVGMVLVIACVNLANLLLARGVARCREIGIRMSIGATRGRVLRQLVVESLVLAALGGAAGIALGVWISHALAAMALPSPFALDTRVLAFSVALSLLTALLFGLAPALSATRVDLSSAIAVASKGGPHHRSLRRMRPLLSAQIALAFVLSVGAVLFGRSLSNLMAIDPGFEREHLVSLWFNASASGYAADDIPALHQRLLDRARSIPGVVSTALSFCGLADGCRSSTTVRFDGYQPSPDEKVQLQLTDVDANYFDTVGMQIVEGRPFDEREVVAGAGVAVVNETVARRYFRDRSPVGQRFGIGKLNGLIVGVVRDARTNDLAEAPVPMAFVPLADGAGPRVLHARVSGDPTAILTELQRSVAQAEPGLIIERASTIERQLERNLTRQRLVAYLTSAFGALALLMACIGLFGVMSYGVALRTTEIGIRAALGARPADLLQMVIGDGVRVAAAGLLLGVFASIAAARIVSVMLFGVSPLDPLIFAAVAVILLVSATLACYAPARRAARADPMAALRAE